MQSCFIILYTNKNNDLYKSLNLLKFKQDLDIPFSSYSQIKRGKEESKVEIFDSDSSGVGKSTKIKLIIIESKKKYIYFPFGGVINIKDIIKRLKDLESKISEPQNCAIHLDLYDTEQVDLMADFLFSILITKIYCYDEDIFYLPKEIEIKIEIPNGFVNLINKFPILDLFDKTSLIIRELNPLIVSKDLNSNVQIVANYLKLLNNNQINNTDLFIKDLTPIHFQSYGKVKRAEILSQEECQELIFKEIKKIIIQPNYYQIKSFIDIIASLFKSFNRNFFLNSNLLKESKADKRIRTIIIESFIKLSKFLIKGNLTGLIEAQENIRKNICLNQFNEEDEIKKGNDELSNINQIFFSSEKFICPIIFFNEGSGIGFKIISNLSQEVGNSQYQNNDNFRDDNKVIEKIEYKKLYDLYNSQINKDKKSPLPNYNIYTQEQFLVELKEILDLKNPVTIKEYQEILNYNQARKKKDKKENKNIDEKNYRDISYLPLETIVGKYIFTPDNFIKMILILLKIRANIPVILMGETGCGKTSLIKMLFKLLNNGDEKKIKIFKIHAGITDKDIIDFIKNELLEEAEKIKKEDDKEEKKLQKGQIYIRKKLWVLLDKINTCKSMELISELMCKNSYQGTRLPSNIVFIATCNPYRCYENEKIKRNDNNNLVYKVNPLPHSLLNYIFDFGHLEPNDEKKYIQTILDEPIKRINKKENYLLSDEQIKKIHIFGTELVSKAQNFTRKIIEISSVSLRDIRRFNIIYEFFYYYLKQKKEDAIIKEENSIKIDIFYKDCDYLTLHKYAIILGVFMCYYLRISDNKTREKFSQEMTDKMRDLDEFFDRKSFLDIPYREEYYILDNIEIEKGIAQNRALLENIFSLFVAINTKIPIFIVGKPGSSKTLSVQLINKAMKGSSSNNFFFKKYPRIILTSYQGTLSSTSKGIENTFIQAKEKYEKINEESKDNNISLVFFDQIGITEFSQNNPLSIINDHLEEFDERKNKISFVGISNWALDPSKMNRGLNLFICEPTEEDLKCSAFTIGESYDKNLVSKYKVFYKGLSSAYYKYKRYLKRAHKKDGKEDFHGIIDFYYLIKYCTKELIKNNIKKEEDIVFLGLERNFGGFKFIPEN